MASDEFLGGSQMWGFWISVLLYLPGLFLFVLSVPTLQRMNAGHHHSLLDSVPTLRSVPQFSLHTPSFFVLEDLHF